MEVLLRCKDMHRFLTDELRKLCINFLDEKVSCATGRVPLRAITTALGYDGKNKPDFVIYLQGNHDKDATSLPSQTSTWDISCMTKLSSPGSDPSEHLMIERAILCLKESLKVPHYDVAVEIIFGEKGNALSEVRKSDERPPTDSRWKRVLQISMLRLLSNAGIGK